MKPERTIVCPHCRASLNVKRPGSFQCPSCRGPLLIPPAAFASKVENKRTESSDGSEEPKEASPPPAPATRQQISLWHRRNMQIGGGLGFVVVLLTLLIVWSPWSGSSVEAPPANQGIQEPGPTRLASQRPDENQVPTDADKSVKPDESMATVTRPRPKSGVPLFDSDSGGLSETKSTSPIIPGLARTSKLPMVTVAVKDPETWAKGTWGVVMQAGDVPFLDGRQVISEVITPTSERWVWVLPAGEHIWQKAASATPQRQIVRRTFAEDYQQQKADLQSGGKWDFERLAQRSKPTGGSFQDPLLPHFWGNYFWQIEESEAAIRLWKHAVRIEPTFAPAYLNLAFAAKTNRNPKFALQQLALAAHCNPLDAYGIDGHVQILRQQLGLWESIDTAPNWTPSEYLPAAQSLSSEARQVVQVLQTMSQYATNPVERVRILNNAGVYLTHRKQPQHAIEPLSEALQILLAAQALNREAALTSTVFSNLEQAYREAGMAEHRLYLWLKEAYQ